MCIIWYVLVAVCEYVCIVCYVICMCASACLCVCMHVCMYACMYVCVCVDSRNGMSCNGTHNTCTQYSYIHTNAHIRQFSHSSNGMSCN
jgi:hypothetical protein